MFERFFHKGDEDIEWNENEPESMNEKRVIGKIIKLELDGGWGFISSKDIKFTRIFFHWSSLNQNTLKFDQLKRGMLVSFVPIEVKYKGIRAIKIEVIKE